MAKANNFPKAMLFYLIREGFSLNYETVVNAVAQQAYKGISKEALSYRAYAPVLRSENAPLVHTVGGFASNPDKGGFVLKVAIEEKVVPDASVVRELDLRIKALEALEGRIIRGKERTAMKMAISEEMALTAPVKFRHVSLMVLPAAGVLVVFVGGFEEAESVTAMLRRTLGTLPIVPYDINNFIGLTGLVVGYNPDVDFNGRTEKARKAFYRNDDGVGALITLGDNVLLRDADKSYIRFSGRGANCDAAVRAINDDSMDVDSISLGLGDLLSNFTLHKDFRLTGMKWMIESSRDDNSLDNEAEGMSLEQYIDLTIATDLELVYGVVTELHQSFFPIFGDVAQYQAVVTAEDI